jgi:pSer/pThr/pTyr-binding forkhead associated (FHA) protein
MPVITVDNKQFSLRPGQNRLGAGEDVDVHVGGSTDSGVHAIVELAADSQVVIRRTGGGSPVRVNGIPLVDPTPLIHGDKVEIAGKELLFADDTKTGDTAFISAADIAAILASKRTGPARATAATGGRLLSLVDGKEYPVPAEGIVIGRDASADVVVAQSDVSRRHAEVSPVESGYELRDFSANGVFVNGTRIERPQILSRADIIRIGSEEFRFYADVPSSSPMATPPPIPVVPPPARAEALANTVSFAALQAAAAASEAPTAESVPLATPAPKPILATLEITNAGPNKGQQFDIHVPLAHVGRGAHNEIVLTDDSVSESHAKLQRRDDGWYVVDLGSTNGTYVGGQRLNAERRLDGAPDVRFGGVKMIFRAKDAAGGGLADTRAIAVGHVQPTPAPSSARVPGSSAANASARPSSRPGISAWVWVVLVLAAGAAVAYYSLNR